MKKLPFEKYLIDVADLITWGIHGKKEWTQVSFSELI